MATTQCPEEAPGQDGTECGCQEPSADTSFQTHLCLRRFPQCLPSLWQQPSRPGLSGMEKRPPKVPRIAWEEKKERPGAAAAWQPHSRPGLSRMEKRRPKMPRIAWEEEKEHPWAAAAWQPPSKPSLSRMEKRLPKMPRIAWEEEKEHPGAAAAWQPPSRPGLSGMEKRPPKVPRIAWEEKKEHPGAAAAWQPNEVEEVQPLQADWNLLEEEQPSNVSSEHVLDKSLSELALGDPHDAVVTLLHRAPLCDREAAAIWRQMVSTSRRPEKVLRELLRVLEDWPLHRTSTSDGDSIHICALAATRALQEISRMPQLPLCFPLFFPDFFLTLLFQVFCSMEELPEEVHALWRGFQQEGRFPTTPSRFAMQTLKILLCRLGLEDVVLEAQRKCVWDTLLYPETRHCAMRILAREMRRLSKHSRTQMNYWLVELLSRKELCWEVPAMAFLAELMVPPDLRVLENGFLQLALRYLQSESSVMWRMVLRGLVTLSNRPSMAERMGILQTRLMNLLGDVDSDVLRMTLFLLRKMLQEASSPLCHTIALELAERLQPLFEHDNSHVQLLSLQLFHHTIEVVKKKGGKQLKAQVKQSMIQLLCLLHSENQEVAEASRVTLLRAATFLKKRRLSQVLERRNTWGAGECLLSECSSKQASQYMQQAMCCLQSQQQPTQEAAIRFLGLIGRHLRSQHEEVQVIHHALQNMPDDISSSVSNLAPARPVPWPLLTQSLPGRTPSHGAAGGSQPCHGPAGLAGAQLPSHHGLQRDLWPGAPPPFLLL
ncbi:uncharacterized protein LOC133626893 isoform X2 [Colius striatus]|uniref:uncharacterized protein LOC133626893 isoform X2 n=1 Tax=Colius striatus TaxID=57412 RepID=UPI002B1E7305|nr:uncharacterized protein LOC133626893 isoform X2 [Colius striatus]